MAHKLRICAERRWRRIRGFHQLGQSVRAIAAHESSQTTRLYDRTGDKITLDEVERIVI